MVSGMPNFFFLQLKCDIIHLLYFVPRLPDQVALELAAVGDDEQLCGPLSTCCVFQEDQTSGSVAEISWKTQHLSAEHDETDRTGHK